MWNLGNILKQQLWKLLFLGYYPFFISLGEDTSAI